MIKHGEAIIRTIEYNAWQAMRERCENANHPEYKNYGGRGISVCDRWWDYENFLADMGRKPSPELTLGRIDNDGDYIPENCKWVSPAEQIQNTRRTKLTPYIVREARRLSYEGYTNRFIAQKFRVEESNLGRAIRKQTWKNI